jgi:hypothetical protein
MKEAGQRTGDYLLGNDIAKLIIALLVVLNIGFMILQALTGPFGFIIALIAPIVISLVLGGLGQLWEGLTSILNSIYKSFACIVTDVVTLLGSRGIQICSTVTGITLAWGDFLVSQINVCKVGGSALDTDKKISAAIGFLLSILGLFLAFYQEVVAGLAQTIARMSSLVLSVWGCCSTWKGMDESTCWKILFAASLVSAETSVYEMGLMA